MPYGRCSLDLLSTDGRGCPSEPISLSGTCVGALQQTPTPLDVTALSAPAQVFTVTLAK